MSTDKLIKESWSIAVADNRSPARVRLWKAIAAVRDACPRVGGDAETEDIIDAILNAGFGDLSTMHAERDTARADALDEAACIADGFGVVGVAPSADDYWAGHNDAAVKIATAIREVAMCDAEAEAERNITDNYPQMKAAWRQEYGGSPKHDDPSPEFEAGWNAHKAAK